jgi:hypothetical protein
MFVVLTQSGDNWVAATYGTVDGLCGSVGVPNELFSSLGCDYSYG